MKFHFLNAGFEDIIINQKNYFDTPRMIASKVNEDANLTTVAGSKSMQYEDVALNTVDTRLTPGYRYPESKCCAYIKQNK